MAKSGNDNGELDLGIQPAETKPEPCCLASPSSEVRYPEVEFRGEHAKRFYAKYGRCAPGDVYRFGSEAGGVDMYVKSSSMGEQDYENCIRFCMTKIIGNVVEEESESEDAGESGEETKPKQRPQLKKVTKTTAVAGY